MARDIRNGSLVRLCKAGAALLAAPAVVAAQAEFTPLGHLAPPSSSKGSRAIAVSGDGTTVVGITSSSATALGSEAFRWRQQSGMDGLGTLPGNSFSGALGVSKDGGYVVGVSDIKAFRWHNGEMIDLGDLPGGNILSSAYEVTEDGRIVYGHSGSGSSPLSTLEAFRWEDGVMVGMGSFPGDVFPTTAEGLSGDESTVVGAGRLGSGIVHYRYRDGFVKNIGELPGGITEGGAQAVSSDGSVVVGFGNSSTGIEASRWTTAHGMVGLGTIAGYSGSSARAVSPDGWAVYGESWAAVNPFEERDAFIWDPIRGMRKLQDVLKQDYGLDLPGWRLRSVNDCSDDGRVIVGDAWNPQGFAEAWRIEMPPFCYADCDNSTGLRTLDVLDFLCFATRFNSKDLYTDCNQDGTHDLFDFLCFLNHFNAGCP